MKKYEFKITLVGYGDDPDEAWRDATEATNLDEDPTPENYEEYEEEA